MIENEQQYRLTVEQRDRFERTLAALEERPREDTRVHPRLRQAEAAGIQSIIEELSAEIAAYEAAQETKLSRVSDRQTSEISAVSCPVNAGMEQAALATQSD